MSAWVTHPTEVRADLQRYYHLNIERMGEEFSIWQAAACVCCLPMGSSLLAATDPKLQYSMTDYLLHRVSDLLAGKHLPYPWEAETRRAIADFGSLSVDEFMEWRNREWRDTHGHEQ